MDLAKAPSEAVDSAEAQPRRAAPEDLAAWEGLLVEAAAAVAVAAPAAAAAVVAAVAVVATVVVAVVANYIS
jgi:hypothetical protein